MIDRLQMLLRVILALSIAGCATSAPPVPDTPALPARQVSEHVWYVQGESGMATRENRGFMSNAGFVVTPDGVVVFDALATPALAQSLRESIRAVTDQPVRLVVLSHYHADHIYGAQVFKAEGAQIWARAEGLTYLSSDLARERLAQRRRDLAPWVNEDTRLLPADRWLRFDGDAPIRFERGGLRFELLNGGDAHTPGDLMLALPDEGVLFAGDLFFTARLPFVVDGNTRDWLAALTRMEHSAARVAIPGHGPASDDVDRDLRATRRYLEFLRGELGQAVDNLESFDEAFARIDWSEFSTMPTFEHAHRRNAYSVYLEMQAEMLAAPR